MSLATKKIAEFIASRYPNNDVQFLRDAIAFFNARAEDINQNRHYESLLLDFIDSYEDD